MSLTMGSGPFGHSPAGRFNLEIPTTEVLFVDPSPRWIRAARDGETVIDSRRAKLLHRHGALPRYFVPRDAVRWKLLARTGVARRGTLHFTAPKARGVWFLYVYV